MTALVSFALRAALTMIVGSTVLAVAVMVAALVAAVIVELRGQR